MVLDVIMKYDGAAPVGFNVNFMGKTKVVTENNPRRLSSLKKRAPLNWRLFRFPRRKN